jgi:hypothetical protein
MALGAADAGEAPVQTATVQVLVDGARHVGAQGAVVVFEAFGVLG